MTRQAADPLSHATLSEQHARVDANTLEFDIDVAEQPALLNPRRVVVVLAVLCGALSSATMFALKIEPTTVAAVTAAPVAPPMAVISPVAPPIAVIGPVAPPAAPSEPAAIVAAAVAFPKVEPSVVAEAEAAAPAPLPVAKRRPKARSAPPKNESGVRTMMKEGAFVIERTGAPIVTQKVAVVVSVPKREAISPAFDPADIDLVMRDRASAFALATRAPSRRTPRSRGTSTSASRLIAMAPSRRRRSGRIAKAPVASLSRCVQTILQRTRFGISTTSTTVSRQLTFRRDDATAPRLPLRVAAAF